MADGKQLEALVKFIESVLLPKEFEVEARERVLDDEGRQIAEFDVIIRGKVGSTEFTWLIECRDRPSSGPAPGSWIEQLVGRRDRFSLDKVTAVSTTGFASGVLEYAESKGIELREVRSVSPADFNWIKFSEMTLFNMLSELKHCRLLISENENPERVAALKTRLSEPEPILLRTTQGADIALHQAFRAAIEHTRDRFEGLLEGQSRIVRVRAEYPEDQFEVTTNAGPVKLPAILFVGEIRLEVRSVPIIATKRYQRNSDGEAISQLAAFGPIDTQFGSYSLELHRIGEEGETHVVLRRLLT